MLKTRLIPCVLLRNGLVVQSKSFCRYQLLGNPTFQFKPVGIFPMGPGREREAVPAESGGLHGFLNVHTEVHDVVQDLKVALGLAVAAGRAQGHERLTILQHDKGAGGGAGALVGR